MFTTSKTVGTRIARHRWVICALLFFATAMGYIQASRAESALDTLRQMAAAHANVMRDGNDKALQQR